MSVQGLGAPSQQEILSLNVSCEGLGPERIKEFAAGFFRYFGSHPTLGGEAVTFRIYAPHAAEVKVLKINASNSEPLALEPKEGGVWELTSAAFKAQDNYLYRITMGSGRIVEKLDPFSMTNTLHGSISSCGRRLTSRVIAQETYPWTDQAWIGCRAERGYTTRPLNIYEMNPCCWKRDDNGNMLNYRQLAPEAASYCRKMHYTHIQLIATLDYSQDKKSVGFKVNSYFSPNSRLGTKEDFQFFVNHLHEQEVGVLLVWIPNHFGGDDEIGLKSFDGTHLFGGAVGKYGPLFDFSKSEARNLLMSSAVYWAEEMHVDGFYVDCTAPILYRSQANASCIDRRLYDPSSAACEFLRDFNRVIHTQFPGLITFSEDSMNTPDWTRFHGGPPERFDYVWHFPYIYLVLPFLAGEQNPDSRSFDPILQRKENGLLPLASSQPGKGTHSLYAKMRGSRNQKFARLRLLHALTIASPGKKLIYMGHDFGQEKDWHQGFIESFQGSDVNFKSGMPALADWEELRDADHQGLQEMHERLNKLYLNESSLWEDEDLPNKGIRNLSFDSRNQVLFFERFSTSKSNAILCVFNFSEQDIPEYKINVQDLSFDAIASIELIFSTTPGCGTIIKVNLATRELTLQLSPLSALYIKSDLGYEEALAHFRKEDRLLVPTLQGTTAHVYFHAQHPRFRSVAPEGVVEKVYFDLRDAPEANATLGRFFENEIICLKVLNDNDNGRLKLLGYDRTSRTILMSRITGETAYQKLLRDPAEVHDIARSLVQNMVRLHQLRWEGVPVYINNEGIPLSQCGEDVDGASQVSWADVLSHYRQEIEKIGLDSSRDELRRTFFKYIHALRPKIIWWTRCNNDPKFDSYYPDSHTVIDFNASTVSPVLRDLGAIVVDLHYSLTFSESRTPLLPREKQQAAICRMILAYEESFKIGQPQFGIDYNLLRLFIALYLIKRGLCLSQPEDKEQFFSKSLKMMATQKIGHADEITAILCSF